jgi:hypothetical protein
MPELIWDETEFITCLEVLPTVEEYGTQYAYVVEKDGLKLELSIYPLCGDVYITLYRDGIEHPIIDFRLLNCSATKYVQDMRGEFLEFAPAQVFGDRYQKDFVIPVGVQLAVKPSISVSLFVK